MARSTSGFEKAEDIYIYIYIYYILIVGSMIGILNRALNNYAAVIPVASNNLPDGI